MSPGYDIAVLKEEMIGCDNELLVKRGSGVEPGQSREWQLC